MSQLRMLGSSDADTFVAHLHRYMPGSGANGAPRFHPYETLDAWSPDPADFRSSWALPPGEDGWSRSWGVFDAPHSIVGHVDVKADFASMATHRCWLGIGLEPAWTARGWGRRLLDAACGWAKASGFSWVDLGVFAENAAAYRLYTRYGFETIGLTRDRFRLQGEPVDDYHMAFDLHR